MAVETRMFLFCFVFVFYPPILLSSWRWWFFFHKTSYHPGNLMMRPLCDSLTRFLIYTFYTCPLISASGVCYAQFELLFFRNILSEYWKKCISIWEEKISKFLLILTGIAFFSSLNIGFACFSWKDNEIHYAFITQILLP